MTLNQTIIQDRAWIDVGSLEDIPRRGSRRVRGPRGDLAVFRTGDDRVFALEDRCPHRQGPLSDGIVSGHAVACPLHNWLIDLATGQPLGDDVGKGCTPTLAARLEAGRVFIAVGT